MKSARLCISVAAYLALVTLTGCGGRSESAAVTPNVNAEEGIQVGDLADMPELTPQQVEGYGIVVGLGQNGSTECPVDILEYLKRYVRVMMPDMRGDPEGLIRSLDTAVVKVTGEIKPGTNSGGRFDVMAKPIQGSQTRSLAGGQLYTTELRAPGKAMTGGLPLATAGGPIFIDPISPNRDNRTGYVLGGGTAAGDYRLVLRLKKADYRMVSALRNRVVQRFGPGTATAQSEEILTLLPPPKFANRQREFVALVKALYIVENDEINKRRVEILTKRLADRQDIARTEAALIGIGRLAAPEVAALLTSPDEEVRLSAAKVMLSYREFGALDVLRVILYDTKSKFRMDALRTIAEWAPDEQTCGILAKMLSDDDAALRLAAEDELVRCGSPLIERRNVGGKFFLDLVMCKGPSLIYVTRAGAPRMAIFGRDMAVNGDVFITAADGSLTITSEITSNTVTIIRSRRGQTGVVGKPLETSRLVADVVEKMSSSPLLEGDRVKLTGLDVAYSDMLDAVKTLCDKGCIKAVFMAGPMGITAATPDR